MTDKPSATPADPIALTKQLGAMADKRIDVLRRIHETGSISEAARAANVSYKAAWQAIETLGNLAGTALVEKACGGAKGGGTKLTPTGLMVLDLSARLARAREQVMREFAASASPEMLPVGSATLRTSMRNQFPATIESIVTGPAKVGTILRIDSENAIKASVTMESSQLLDLRQGKRVLALFKATTVEIVAEAQPTPGFSVIRGTVISLSRAHKGGEASLRLAGGTTVVGFIRKNHGLSIGDAACAVVPAGSVVIGLFE